MLPVITLLAGLIGACQGVCPPAEWIGSHCNCQSYYYGNVMKCSKLLNPYELINSLAIITEKKYHIFSIEIEDSSLLYIPHDAFKGGKFETISFYQCQLLSLSDDETAFDGLEETLEELRATQIEYMTHWDWQQLRLMQKLRLIDIKMSDMEAIYDPFPPLKNLKSLGITKARISFIADHAFENLLGLQILNLMDNKIQELTRSMLHNPASELLILDLSINEISRLPTDFFQGMPNLEYVSLKQNKLIVLPEETYKWALLNLKTLHLEGNKFFCHCRMRWLTASPFPKEFTATCERPKFLNGKRLADLKSHELYC